MEAGPSGWRPEHTCAAARTTAPRARSARVLCGRRRRPGPGAGTRRNSTRNTSNRYIHSFTTRYLYNYNISTLAMHTRSPFHLDMVNEAQRTGTLWMKCTKRDISMGRDHTPLPPESPYGHGRTSWGRLRAHPPPPPPFQKGNALRPDSSPHVNIDSVSMTPCQKHCKSSFPQENNNKK